MIFYLLLQDLALASAKLVAWKDKASEDQLNWAGCNICSSSAAAKELHICRRLKGRADNCKPNGHITKLQCKLEYLKLLQCLQIGISPFLAIGNSSPKSISPDPRLFIYGHHRQSFSDNSIH